MFGKFTSRHRSTLLCAKFVKIVRREFGESVRYLPDQKKNFGFLSNCGYCADRAQKSAMASPKHLPDKKFPNFIQIGSLSRRS